MTTNDEALELSYPAWKSAKWFLAALKLGNVPMPMIEQLVEQRDYAGRLVAEHEKRNRDLVAERFRLKAEMAWLREQAASAVMRGKAADSLVANAGEVNQQLREVRGSKMSDKQEISDDSGTGTYYEWGYRLPDGHVEWQGDYGTDGSWTSYMPDYGIESVDIYNGSEFKAIREALDKAKVPDAVVLRRLITVTRGCSEEVTSG